MAGTSIINRPATKDAALEYIKRKLGGGMMEINVTDEQFDDCISDAVVYFQENHADGTYETFYKYQIKASVVNFATSIENIFAAGDTLTGQSGGAKIYVIDIAENFLSLRYFTISGTLATNEVLANGVLSKAIVGNPVIGDLDNKYIPVNANVESITDIVSTNGEKSGFGNTGELTSGGVFSSTYEFNRIQTYTGYNSNLVTRYLATQHQALLRYLTDLKPVMDFNRFVNKIFLSNFDWLGMLDKWLIFRVMVAVDPVIYPEMWADTWFLRYVTELVRKQWGVNLSKFEGVQILGGITLDGKRMIEEAKEEITKLQEEMDSKYRMPDDFFMA